MRCHWCHGPFGLLRQRLLTFSGYLSFCSRRCKQDYRKHLQQEVRKRKFQKWLADETSR
jgi:hypothetical protein